MNVNPDMARLGGFLEKLGLGYVSGNCEDLARQAIDKRWSHLTFLEHLIEGECLDRYHHRVERLLRKAKLPPIKTLDQFDWEWPEEINAPLVQDLFRLNFIRQKTNAVFVGNPGTGKTHLLTALGYHACHQGHTVLYTTAIEAVTRLIAAKEAKRLRAELKRYRRPEVVLIDELGFLSLDHAGADLMFQLVCQRYEWGSLVITTNKEYKKWIEIMAKESSITTAILDRVLHHCDTVTIKGESYRMKGRHDAKAVQTGAG